MAVVPYVFAVRPGRLVKFTSRLRYILKDLIFEKRPSSLLFSLGLMFVSMKTKEIFFLSMTSNESLLKAVDTVGYLLRIIVSTKTYLVMSNGEMLLV